jgi:hypothetical protein
MTLQMTPLTRQSAVPELPNHRTYPRHGETDVNDPNRSFSSAYFRHTATFGELWIGPEVQGYNASFGDRRREQLTDAAVMPTV